ncbi:MAG: phenylacetic acid degradation bifunctional protein PaaZ [Gammaproteobacteria bacterium]|nr:phenylacetic acid degradation bifunctional protein PaaZ [Gammaproteobacteria bacterium]MDH3863779.1 phenylacetic acid degradation bifunctional protein PaaZ [Gammaproteobacteria bacterium]MDH3906820.1 phenylacetic acid degradation bifunctional protein PaaZ [Gammaproteobacteria bacterium]MDH3907972.1 phenylacetic acid degradation bifunctional protein PaaZ [Gammaproteobacteria bacterium]MDH3953385.1 phenylacetic acid degradation bifunctional protein PaaZ [Gammaproteobacteria bacterium]
MKLGNLAQDRWIEGDGTGKALSSAVTGEPIVNITSDGLDFRAMLEHARNVGGTNLRKMTFHERGDMLKSLAQYLMEQKKAFYALSTETGATRADSWIDIDGGISTLFVFSSKARREMPNDHVYLDGPPEQLSRNGTFIGQHIYTPKLGAAVHINAFNFPVWGMLEKLAPTLAAGVPAIVKPASSTAYLTELAVRSIIESGILPPGSLQLICGGVGDLFDHLNCQDTIAFTGSKTTAEKLQQHPRVVSESVAFTAETDSLNASILGPDAVPGTPEFDLYIKEVVREMTSKAGQKCTAIRRIIAPASIASELVDALSTALGQVRVGNPANKEVGMGALASLGQREEVRARVGDLAAEADIVFGGSDDFEVVDADARKGAFFMPTLLHCQKPMGSTAVHSVEAFGPVSTVLPYGTLDEAIELARMGEGSLAGSIITNDNGVARELVLGTAAYHGRMLVVNRHCADESTGHGSPLPHLVHGGPGRAGGGEEMGGIRGIKHYMQRTAIQGSPETLSVIGHRWTRGADEKDPGAHPFRKTFEQLELGDTFRSELREVSLDDINHFAEFTGDTFYAHMDEEAAASNPFFEGRVAHGYLIVSFAAGLFVDPDFGPVLANYGIDDLRFITPLNHGDSMRVRLTCKQKTLRGDTGYGEVRWDTEITNQDDEIVAQYDVLTMVATDAHWASVQ